ncbi:MAG: hypothetical protein SXA11_21185 [Cyanobacteriota bacterium]|nr:hypothetical protein [Cyanobacteriota bacterium]
MSSYSLDSDLIPIDRQSCVSARLAIASCFNLGASFRRCLAK